MSLADGLPIRQSTLLSRAYLKPVATPVTAPAPKPISAPVPPVQALPAHKRGYQAVNQEQFSPLVHIHQRGVRRVCVAVQAVRDAAQMVTANVHNLPFASNFHAGRRSGIKTTGLPGLQ